MEARFATGGTADAARSYHQKIKEVYWCLFLTKPNLAHNGFQTHRRYSTDTASIWQTLISKERTKYLGKKKSDEPRDKSRKGRLQTPHCLSQSNSCARSVVSTEMATASPSGGDGVEVYLQLRLQVLGRVDDGLPVDRRLRRGSLRSWKGRVLRRTTHEYVEVR